MNELSLKRLELAEGLGETRLAAGYALTADPEFRAFAKEIGARMSPAFFGTLGPSGTTSEDSLFSLKAKLEPEIPEPFRIRLFNNFNLVHEALLAGAVSHILIPNAYEYITRLYWDPRLSISYSYYHDTPSYGFFKRPDKRIEGPIIIFSSCPAVYSLLEHLSIEGHDKDCRKEILSVSSTENAAKAALDRNADLAITNIKCAEKYGLVPVSKLYKVKMLWTVFKLNLEF